MQNTSSLKIFYNENKHVVFIAAIAILLHFFVNIFTHYGIFRDELYYIACSKHLAFGYVDQPPLAALILFFNNLIFGSSVFSIRILPALCHAAVIIYTGLIVKELSGSKTARVIASLSVLISGVYLSIFNFYSMNCFDILFWTICVYLVIRIINTDNQKLWIYFGVAAGLAFENKLSIVFLAAGIVIGLILTDKRKWLLNKYFWVGAAVAIVLSIPNIIWQMLNNYPTLEFMRNAVGQKNAPVNFSGFTIEQIMLQNPSNIFIWLPGLIMLLISKRLKQFRLFGIAYVFLFLFFIIQHGKPYYLSPVYPVLFAAGAIFIDSIPKGKNLVISIIIPILIIGGLIGLPMSIPLLPEETFIKYSAAIGIKPGGEERDNPGPLGQHYADMHGWKEMADSVWKVYSTLSPEDKAKCSIFLLNYGQAGAVEYFAPPDAKADILCRHNNYWLWGPGKATGDVMIIVDDDDDDDDERSMFNEHYKEGTIDNKYSRSFERHLKIYVCKGKKFDMNKMWDKVKFYM